MPSMGVLLELGCVLIRGLKPVVGGTAAVACVRTFGPLAIVTVSLTGSKYRKAGA